MTTSKDPVRFHLSLNVADLKRSVEFFSVLFGMAPAKLRPDYAKFEPDAPPLVLSLEPTARPTGGLLNHAGFRMPDVASLVAMQERLERAGVRTQRAPGVEWCYGKQTNLGLRDPDGTLWKIYTFEGDLDHRGAGQTQEAVVAAAPKTAEPVSWEHRMGDPVPYRIPLADGAADEIRLRGSFYLPPSASARRALAEDGRAA